MINSFTGTRKPCNAGLIPSVRDCDPFNDDEIIATFIEIKVIGRWTVEMLLTFNVDRPDVLPVLLSSRRSIRTRLRREAIDIVLSWWYRANVNMTTDAEVLNVPARQTLDRARKTFEAIVHHAGSAGLEPLQTSTNEVSFLMQATRLAIDALGISADVAEKKLHEARLRGLARMAELRKAAEPCLETGQVCDLLGVSRETVRKKVDRKQLLALPKGGDRVFPAFQFHDGDVVAGLGDVLVGLETDSPFVALSFLLSRSPDFDNRTAIEALQAGDRDAVVCEARGFLTHGH